MDHKSDEITIPPELPGILTKFTKAAMRTQPVDLLEWSSAYFDALVKKEMSASVQNRLEKETLTEENVLILYQKFGSKPTVKLPELRDEWKKMNLQERELKELIKISGLAEEVDWLIFIMMACYHLRKNITKSLQLVCKIISKDSVRDLNRIEIEVFKKLYEFLTSIDGKIAPKCVSEVLDYLTLVAEKQDGMVGPKDFMTDQCPSFVKGH